MLLYCDIEDSGLTRKDLKAGPATESSDSESVTSKPEVSLVNLPLVALHF